MIRCSNARCKWHDAKAPIGCALFAGRSWLDCRTKTIRKETTQPNRKDPQQ